VYQFEGEEFLGRIDALQRVLLAKGLDWAIINANADLYYFAGSVQPLYLLIPARGDSFMLARKGISRIAEEVRHLKLEPFSNGKEIAVILNKYGVAASRKIGLTLDAISYATVQRLQKNLGTAQLEDISLAIRSLRMVKSAAEISVQLRAAAILAKVPELVQSYFQPGMTELELSAILENYFRLNGHSTLLRCRREGVEMAGYGICSSGIHSLSGTKFEGVCSGLGATAAAPYGAAPLPIPANVPVILDYAFNLEGYHVDQTRMFCWGTPSPEFLEAYEAMLKIEEAVERELKPGKVWGELYELSAAMAKDFGYENEYMGSDMEKVRFVGHGVGLELDELPLLAADMKDTLTCGMVIAVEPKVALPGIGVVGIEDTYVIQPEGVQWLTRCGKEIILG
jgi:Xaa-Pro aminopeptidase